MSKKCTKCKIDKTFDLYYKDKYHKDGLCSCCKECSKIVRKNWLAKKDNIDFKNHKKWVSRNRHKLAAYNRKYINKNREMVSKKWRMQALKYKYGITYNEYCLILEKQNNTCFICKKEEGDGVRFCVDHCHKTNKVRGILCTHCNSMIGFAKDDIKILSSGIEYLIKNV